MKKAQLERFKENKISGLVYNIRMKKYQEKLNEIKQMLPVLETKLERYHLVGMLLIILWRLKNTNSYYVFKRYLKFIEYQFYPEKIKELLIPP